MKQGMSQRIAVLTQDFAGGGAQRMMVNIALGLAARGHDVEIVAVRPEGPFLSRVPAEIPIVTLGPRRVSRSILPLTRYLRERRPKVVLATLVHVNVAAVLARRLSRIQTRLVLREANRIGSNARAAKLAPIRLAYRLLPRLYSQADHVIAVSHAVADEILWLTGLPVERVTTLPNPVLGERELAAIDAADPPPHPWLGDETVPVVLSVGRLAFQKDHRTLLDAFAQLRLSRRARLVILGDGPLELELREHSRRLGITADVHFAGFAARPETWMKHASLLAHTSRWEGFPNVLVEALACGLPVVSTNCPTGPEEILEAGRYGRLVPVGDPPALAGAISATLDRPPSGNHLRRRAAAFTVEAVMIGYEAVLLGTPSSGAGRGADSPSE